MTNPAYVPPPPKAPAPAPPPPGPFAATRYRFTTGLRAGETATIRDDGGRPLLTYRAFASVVGVVAALLSGIVFVAGTAAALFLFAERHPIAGALAAVLTAVFTITIALLVPREDVTLFHDGTPALTISQRSVFPAASYVVATPDGATLALIRKSPLSRLGRNRWRVLQNGLPIAEAVEESFARAIRRKLLGKFSRRFETNVRIDNGPLHAGWIIRRPDHSGAVDVLELTGDAVDRRVAVALATLVLGREP